MSTEIVKQEQQLQVSSGDELVKLIQWAVVNPDVDPSKLSALFDLKMKAEAERQRVAYTAAMSRLTAKLPEVLQGGKSHHGKYARLIDIDRAIRPLIAGEGFAMSFDSFPAEKNVRVTCKLSHSDGHSESKTIDLPLDVSGNKNPAQSVISTVSYGRRALTKMFFNLMESDGTEDDDGNGGSPHITEEQARDLQVLLDETKSDVPKFLKIFKANKISEILSRQWPEVLAAIEQKRRSQR